MLSSSENVAGPVISWAHTDSPQIPAFADAESKRMMKTHFGFWRTVDAYVHTHDTPLKRFKHAAQSFYSKTKGGIDGSAQARAILRSSTSALSWEQKLVTQTLKTLLINAFKRIIITWRISERRSLLQNKQAFGKLDTFRHNLNSTQSLADFTIDAAREMLVYADEVQKVHQRNIQGGDEELLSDNEFGMLRALAVSRKRNRLAF